MPFCSLMDPSSSLILRDLFPSPQSPEGKRTLFGNQGRASTGMMCQANSGYRYLNGISYSLVSIFGFNLSALLCFRQGILISEKTTPRNGNGTRSRVGRGWLALPHLSTSRSPCLFLFLFCLSPHLPLSLSPPSPGMSVSLLSVFKSLSLSFPSSTVCLCLSSLPVSGCVYVVCLSPLYVSMCVSLLSLFCSPSLSAWLFSCVVFL